MRVFEAVCDAHWAITEEALRQIQEIAARENDVTPEALEAYRAQSVARAERAGQRDSVGLLYVEGALFKRANLMTKYSGASSYEVLMQDLRVLLDDAAIRSIAMVIDSPGGEVNGAGEFAKAVYAARDVKPITAYVSGKAASAGYWIASAASEIVVSEDAVLGSIGVVASIVDTTGRDERLGVKKVELVSSAAPGKRPDFKSDEGRAQIVKTLDDLHTVFASAVASYRGVSVETVNTKFGRGGLEVGANAVALGMADRVGTLEGVISALSKPRGVGRLSQRSNGGFLMSDTPQTFTKADLDKAVAEASAQAQASAQARVSAILGADAAKTLPTLASALAFQTALPAEQAQVLLDAAAKDQPKAAAPQAETTQGFVDRKAAAGGLVVGQPSAADVDPNTKVADGWKAAVSDANRQFQHAAA